MNAVEGVLPYWLDRPEEEALEVADAVRRAGLRALWIGELISFDAVALATAIGTRAEGRLPLKLGPLAIGVRSPVSLAFAASSVAILTGSEVELVLGASSPMIVAGWHDRPWEHAASRMRETVALLRRLLAGERSGFEGEHVRSHGFKLRRPMPQTRIGVAAYGPAMTRVAARYADEVVLNLVPPSHVAAVRETIEREAASAGRSAPALAVWVPAALDPDERSILQLASQLAVYLGAPGYGEMFAELGFAELVQRARSGTPRAALAQDVPRELLAHVCALGGAEEVRTRIDAYHAAGADVVGVAPSTATDPAGAGVLGALAHRFAGQPPGG